MRTKRSTIECANTLLIALQSGREIGRAQVVGMGLLSGDEFARARKSLLKEGLICLSPSAVGGRRTEARYTVTGNTIKSSGNSSLHSRHVPVQPNFDRLLRAWKIDLPAVPAMLPTMQRLRFTREESD